MTSADKAAYIGRQMEERNAASAAFFSAEAGPLARACAAVSRRFTRGGRLFSIGSDSTASDAQHVAVEFAHPVLVGKRALPAIHLIGNAAAQLPALLRPEDIVMGFAPPAGDAAVDDALSLAASLGAFCFALPGRDADYAAAPASPDPFIHQELIEILYHTLWETVHVFLERQPIGQRSGAASFLYPFLDGAEDAADAIVPEVAVSIEAKARTVAGLRTGIARDQADAIAAAAEAMRDCVGRGGAVLCFGNGGSATDANDLALDLTCSPKGYRAVAAISLSSEPATLTAIANDIGAGAMFARQLMAAGRPGDLAFAISTSGGSASIMAGLSEARARGMFSVAMLGYDGGEVARRGLADCAIVVDSDQIPRIQEAHASIYHVIIELLHQAGRG